MVISIVTSMSFISHSNPFIIKTFIFNNNATQLLICTFHLLIATVLFVLYDLNGFERPPQKLWSSIVQV